jgi:hypothetical protein
MVKFVACVKSGSIPGQGFSCAVMSATKLWLPRQGGLPFVENVIVRWLFR